MASQPSKEKVGNGAWYAGHIMAATAETPEEKQAVLFYIKVLKAKFMCKRCRTHFIAFSVANPETEYLSTPMGLSIWFWQAQNNANADRRSRGEMVRDLSWDEYHALYYKDEIGCTKDCDDKAKLPLPTETPLTFSVRPLPYAPVVVSAPLPPGIPLGFRLLSPNA